MSAWKTIVLIYGFISDASYYPLFPYQLGRIECTEQNSKFSSIQNTFSTLFSALFGLGEADDPDVLKRNLFIGDNHTHFLTRDDRRQLCDSSRLSYEELQALMQSVS